jgi:1-acyl-sn-glycerol-3-phosphate acyltransferase
VIRAIIWALFYAVMIPLIGLVGIPWTFITGRVDWMYSAAMWAAFTGAKIAGARVNVRGLDTFDNADTYIYMCNHVSNLDPPLVVPSIPKRSAVLVKKELFRIPLLGKAMRMASFVPVDRSNRDAAIASIQRASEVLHSGVNIIVFPEGTRSSDGKLLPFKKGPFHMAMESGVAVVPMTIYGTETMMPKKTWKITKGTATLVFHPPMKPTDFADREALMAAVRDKIAGALPTKMQ